MRSGLGTLVRTWCCASWISSRVFSSCGSLGLWGIWLRSHIWNRGCSRPGGEGSVLLFLVCQLFLLLRFLLLSFINLCNFRGGRGSFTQRYLPIAGCLELSLRTPLAQAASQKPLCPDVSKTSMSWLAGTTHKKERCWFWMI